MFFVVCGGLCCCELVATGGAAAQIAVVTSEALLCVCVCVCVCVWSRCLRVCGGGVGGQISPSGGQDGASCGRGATRSAPCWRTPPPGIAPRPGSAPDWEGGKGAASFVKVAVASCRATKAAASAAGIAQASSCQHKRGWTVAGEDLVMRSARVPQLARRPRDEICSRTTPGQDRAGDLQRVRLTS